MSPRLQFALETARIAGDATLRHFHSRVEFELKGDLSPVTLADREAESLIRAEIERSYPRDAVLGEEEGGDESADDRWVVDPIDGTKSFVAGVPLYATLLAYEVDRIPTLGVAYFPALGQAYYAETGQGAHRDAERIRVRDNSVPDRAIVCCGGHRSVTRSGRDQGLARIAEWCMATRTWCDAYGHCLVAAGNVDAMIDPLVSRWDISAVSVIVKEAGGRFTDFTGADVLTDEAVSCQPLLQAAVLGAFSS